MQNNRYRRHAGDDKVSIRGYGLDEHLPFHTSKLIILRITKTPHSIESPQAASTNLPV